MDKPLIGLLCSRVRVEEKWLIGAMEKKGINFERIDDRTAVFDLENTEWWKQFDVILERSISYARGLYATRLLNGWGIPTVNMASVAEVCGDKLATSAALSRAGIPQPRTLTAFTVESALDAIEEIGYPVVLKPVVGSWGRLLAKINDREAAEAILEHKVTLGSYQHSIFYLQEFIQKPGRDIRAIVIGDQTVCAIYRKSDHWITNTARGGNGEICEVTDELNELCLNAASAVGGGVLAIDLIEHPDRGYLVNEINHTLEFHTAAPITSLNISDMIIDYVLRIANQKSDSLMDGNENKKFAHNIVNKKSSFSNSIRLESLV